jgi:hypothetical protein
VVPLDPPVGNTGTTVSEYEVTVKGDDCAITPPPRPRARAEIRNEAVVDNMIEGYMSEMGLFFVYIVNLTLQLCIITVVPHYTYTLFEPRWTPSRVSTFFLGKSACAIHVDPPPGPVITPVAMTSYECE